MNLLLITYVFPPSGGVGVLRALSLTKYLPDNGVRVDVLTARNAAAVGKDLSLLKQVPEGTTVHRSWTIDLPFALRKAIKQRLSGKGGAKKAGDPPGRGSVIKRLIGDLLLPDPQVGWLPFAFPAAKRIIRQRKIDAVIITAAPYSSLMLASKLRPVFPDLPILLDFRDEWLTTALDLISFNNNERARRIAERVEREVVRDCTAVVAVSEAARLEMMGRYPEEDPAKFRYVANGFETRPVATAAAVAARTDDRVVLTYIGTVYRVTDPTSFVEAVLALPAELRARLVVRFIGHVETEEYRATLQRLGDTVELKGFMPQAEALRAIDDSDYMLLITHDRINVSAKFFDYLSGSKPIVAAVVPSGDVRLRLEETGAGYWADVDDPAAISSLLRSILSTPPTAPPLERKPAEIAKYHRRVLAAQYADLLIELDGKAKAKQRT